jgi:hypothetical protein
LVKFQKNMEQKFRRKKIGKQNLRTNLGEKILGTKIKKKEIGSKNLRSNLGDIFLTTFGEKQNKKQKFWKQILISSLGDKFQEQTFGKQKK